MRKGQIWIETVLYTLMGLALIGIVLAIATPKINESKDRILIEQTIESLKILDEKINELLDKGAGNVRNIPEFTIKRGEIYINSTGEEIIVVVDGLSKPYSEVGISIREGAVAFTSYEGQRSSYVRLVLDYKNLANITYDGTEEDKKFSAASTPYSFSLRNSGGEGISQIDIEETSRG